MTDSSFDKVERPNPEPKKYDEQVQQVETNIPTEDPRMLPKNKNSEVTQNEENFSPIQPSESPIALTGNIPPELQQRLNRQSQVEEQDERLKPINRQNNKSPTIGSSNFDVLLAKLKNEKEVVDQITLPSLGKFYDGNDGPKDGILNIVRMTGHEESVLSTYSLSRKGLAMDMIFDNCIKDPFLSKDLLTEDRTYLMLYLRAWSFQPEYEVELKCPFTDRKFTEVIDLNNDLIINYCPEDFTESSLVGKLPSTGVEFSYKLPRGRDEQASRHQAELVKKRNKNQPNKPDESVHYRISQLLNHLGGVNDKQEIMELLKNLPISDTSYLRNTVLSTPFGVDTSITVLSPFSEEEFEINLPLESSFFFPETKKET